MPAPRRPTSAVTAALAASLLAACGGSTPAPPITCDVPSVVTVGAGESWRLFGPAEWNPACQTLTVNAPALATDERLALVLVNAGGPDGATPVVDLAGTLAFAAADAAPVASVAFDPLAALAVEPVDRTALEAGHALVVERRRAATEAWLAEGARAPARPTARTGATAAAAPAVGDPWKDARGPCVFSYSTSSTTRRPATLRHLTTHALFYVTDDVWAGFESVLLARPDLWATLESYFEGTASTRNPDGALRILPALHEDFGVESDVDGNGRLVFLFADLGRTGSGGFTVGYFDGTDVVRPVDTSADCSLGASNGADMLYLLDPCTFNKNGSTPPRATCDGAGGYPFATILDQEVPGTMAHELQHDVLFNTRCLASRLPSCAGIDDPARDLWLNEGLSMVSEDQAGFGLNGPSEQHRVGVYLTCRKPSGSSALCHRDVSLTTWPAAGGDPYGHYGGAHAFLRWLLDQAGGGCLPGVATGCTVSEALVSSPLGSRPAVAAASGLGFEEGYARFSTAALFSGEDALFAAYPLKPAPAWSYAPSPARWSPLHTTVGRVGFTSLPRPGGVPYAATLHADGWATFVSGKGQALDAALTVTSGAAVKPRAAVVRFKGTLPLP